MTDPAPVTLRDLADQVAALTQLRDMAEQTLAARRAQLSQALRHAHATQGVKQVTARLGSLDVATATWARPRTPYVTEPLGKLAWVQDRFPEQVEAAIRPAFDRTLMARLSIEPEGVVVYIPTGEIVAWAAAPSPVAGYLRTTFATGGRAALAEAWRDGTLIEALGGLLDNPGLTVAIGGPE